MARVKDQDIPPDLQEDYEDTLGSTRETRFPGEKHPGLDDQVQSKYPPRLEPPHVPTEKQLKQREYFQITFKCFNEATDNERTAYWRLSKAGPIRYYNDYMRKNIPLAMQGHQCPFWAEPNARSFISDEGHTWGRWELHLTTPDECSLAMTLELDPIEPPPEPPPYPTPDAPYGLIHYWYNWQTHIWVIEELETFDPAARAEYEVAFELPEIPGYYPVMRNVFFTRYGQDDKGEAVIWDYDIDDPGATLGLWFFD
jgi:hypothetical protein